MNTFSNHLTSTKPKMIHTAEKDDWEAIEENDRETDWSAQSGKEIVNTNLCESTILLTSVKHNACIACCAFLGKEGREKLQLKHVLPESRSQTDPSVDKKYLCDRIKTHRSKQKA